MRKLSALAVAFLALCGSAAADFTVRQDAEFPRWSSGQVYYSEWDGCAGGVSTAGGHEWISSATGTGASVSGAAPTSLNDPCSAAIDLGTVATNDSGVRTSVSAFDLGNGELCTTAWIREVVVSDDVTADFIARVGISNGDTEAIETGGAYFRYNDDVNAGEWQAVAEFGDVETGTAFDTNIVYTAGTSRFFRVCINAAATSATFYHSTTSPYNMTALVTHSANIPTGTDGVGIVLERTVGTAASLPMNINFLSVEFKPTTPRW